MSVTQVKKSKRAQPVELPEEDVFAEGGAQQGGAAAGGGAPGAAVRQGTHPTAPPAELGVLRYVELDWLVPTPRNPRGPVDEKSAAFAELVASVKANGVLQNLVARPLPAELAGAAGAYQKSLGPVQKGQVRAFPDAGAMFEVVCGARRLAAARAAGLASVPVKVCALDDKQAMEITFVENFARSDLRPLQEARGVQQMLDVGWPIEAVAERIGKTAAWVARRAKLLNLSREWQAAIAEEAGPFALWPAPLLESIARLPAGSQQAALELLRSAWDDDLLREEIGHDGLVPTLAELNLWLRGRVLRTLGGAGFKLDDATLDPKAGPCTTCPKRASQEKLLFDELQPAGKKVSITHDRCLDNACLANKQARFVERRIDEERQKHGKVLPVFNDHVDWVWPRCPTQQTLQARFTAERVGGYNRLQEVKEGTPGARPAVRVDAEALGKLVWVASYEDATAPRGGPGGKPAAQKKEPGQVTPLKERREQLDNRRRALVLEKLRAALEKQAKELAKVPEAKFAADFDDDLVRKIAPAMTLAAVFGTQSRADDRGGDDWPRLWKEYETLQRGNGGNWLEQAARRLAIEVIGVLVRRLDPWGGLENVAKVYPHAQRVAGIFKIAIDQFWGEAVVEIPEPASWAREEQAAKGVRPGTKARRHEGTQGQSKAKKAGRR